jgi:anti-anti-sigma factor
MKVKIRKKGPVVLLYVEGKLTIPKEVELRNVVRDLLRAGERLFVLNMTSCPFLDSAGLGETVACWQRVQEVGGKIVLVTTGKTYSLFVMTGLNRVFSIYDDEEEALTSFIPGVEPSPSRLPSLGRDRLDGRRELGGLRRSGDGGA